MSLLALVSAAGDYAILVSRALPLWTGRFALEVAVLNLVAVPSIFGGTDAEARLVVAETT